MDLETNFILQCSFFEVDLLDLKARVSFPLVWVLSFVEVNVVDLEAKLFLAVRSFSKETVFLVLEARLVLMLLLGA